MKSLDRRQYIASVSALAAAGAVAGCSDGGNGTDDPGGDGTPSNANMVDAPQAVDDYLSGANEYDDQMADLTGEDQVDVNVGDNYFEPPAIQISPGTQVTWVWVGSGTHNVVAENEDFMSGDSPSDFQSGQGTEYQHTFENTGTWTYYCQPHKPVGMKGAVVVTDE